MCGIAGFAGEDQAKIERMTGALRHRGPDGNAFWVGKEVSLGHARLAILDPRPVGDQPMWNKDKTVVIVYNGEIFNYRELKEREGFVCETGTDTEVILKLYDKHGIGFVKDLIGMFAFGLYDTKTRTWYVARDPSGIKPIFISSIANRLHFASEMRSLLSAFTTKPAISEASLSLYLRLQYVPGPRTLCEGVESLPPGTVLRWKDGIESRERVLPNVPGRSFKTKEEMRAALPDLMDTAVRSHLVSDRPVGIYLSGGMDSSILLHHMARSTDHPVRTFTVRFEASQEEGAARLNADAELASLTAKHYGTQHTEVFLTADLYREHYRRTARALDQPNADAVSVAQVLLSQEAKKSVDVALTGAGGDELFGGYPRYRIARILDAARMVPPGLRALAGTFLGHPSDVLRMTPGAALAERLLARPIEEVASVIRGEWFDPHAATKLFQQRYDDLDQRDPVRAFMEFDRHLWLIDESLRLADATTMAHGVEGRVPFLDPRVIAASLGSPAHWHVELRRTKALLKDAYRGILPDHLYTLPKASFFPPLAKWIRREAAPLVEEMLAHKRIAERFDVDALRKVFEDHKAKTRYGLHILSTLMQLACWFDEVYDAAPAEVGSHT